MKQKEQRVYSGQLELPLESVLRLAPSLLLELQLVQWDCWWELHWVWQQELQQELQWELEWELEWVVLLLLKSGSRRVLHSEEQSLSSSSFKSHHQHNIHQSLSVSSFLLSYLI